MIEFFVPGIPKPKGSHKAFVIPGTNRAIVTNTNNPTLKPWVAVVTAYAYEVRPQSPWEGPIRVALLFCMPPPKSLPKTIISWPCVSPDIDKLTRTILDCLKGIAYRDDGQVVKLETEEEYRLIPGVAITVEKYTQGGFFPPSSRRHVSGSQDVDTLNIFQKSSSSL